MHLLTFVTIYVDRCGNVGKLTRIAAAVAEPTFREAHPRHNTNTNAPFLVLGGYADFITSSAFVQGHGAITGLANITPVSAWLVCSAVYRILISPSVCAGKAVRGIRGGHKRPFAITRGSTVAGDYRARRLYNRKDRNLGHEIPSRKVVRLWRIAPETFAPNGS
jgi:hypothetical protein